MVKVRMVAVDMDGTFLGFQKNAFSYDIERFEKVFASMKKNKIEFVVASANQYAQLISFFPKIKDEISFAAENGTYIVSKGTEVYHAAIQPSTIKLVAELIRYDVQVSAITCGYRCAYYPKNMPQDKLDYVKKYYYQTSPVDDIYAVDDDLLKIALTVDEFKVSAYVEMLREKLCGLMTVAFSGGVDIDLMPVNHHKAFGLKLLAQRYNIQSHEIVAFGDSGNDYEMLEYVGLGVAMGNAASLLREVCNDVTDSNWDQGVLNYLERLMNDEWTY